MSPTKGKLTLADLIAARKKAKAKETKIEQPSVPPPATGDKMASLRARLEAAKQGKLKHPEVKPEPEPEPITAKEVEEALTEITPNASASEVTGMHGELITYNDKQQEFIDLVRTGKSCVLLGAAGTGKTTATQGAIKARIESGDVAVLQSDGHSHLVSGTPGIIITAYTRRAVNNIRKVQMEDMKSNCVTAHKLLEYQPEYFTVIDPETGDEKKSMRFIPGRDINNPLPSSICTIVVEEGSMLSVDLYNQIEDAIGHPIQWVFIGDIEQLPPVFGPAILGFKMLSLPVVQLTHVYRQALESPIIRLAHRILSGKPLPVEEFNEWKYPGELTLHPWKKKIKADRAVLTMSAFLTGAIDNNQYDPYEDMVLIPYNQSCGTIELNCKIANHLARKRDAMTYEIMAGYNKHYFSEGDRVLYDREDAEIISIEYNPAYTGARVQPPSRTLDYNGYNPNLNEDIEKRAEAGDDFDIDIDLLLDQVAAAEDRVTQSSHKVVIRLLDTGSELTLDKAAAVNALLLSYALTVHKSQGSEWKKVFLMLHQSHATMLQRELLYTAITRAREELYVICEPETFVKGIESQRVKGTSLEEKAEFFKGKELKKSNRANGES